VTLAAVVLVSVPASAGASSDDETEAGDLILTEIGEGWDPVDAQGGPLADHTRTFRSVDGELSIIAISVTTPPGVEVLFRSLTGAEVGLEALPEPSLELAAWLVSPGGGAPGDDRSSVMVVASREHLFTVILNVAEGATLDGPALVLDIARRQIQAAGGPPSQAPALPPREVDDDALLAWLPEEPPPGYGLDPQPLSASGPGGDEIDLVDAGDVSDFLSRRSKVVARVWVSDNLGLGVGITQYPYDIFAAVALHVQAEHRLPTIGDGRIPGLPDVVTIRKPEKSQVGIVFRRDDVLVTVLAEYVDPDTEATAIALATDMATAVADRLPSGDTSPYDPAPPSRLLGLTLTAAFVSAAVGGSRAIALLRARRVRRRWSVDEPPAPLPPPGSPPTRVVELDADAAVLRRRGRALAAVQLLTVVLGVVALAGDFALAGVIVGALALIAGLAVSHWWMRHEHTLLGPAAPPRAFVFPRLPGAALGLVTFAVLGIGVSYLLKGVRYLVLSPTLAQLRWSNLLGISPRAVGVAFAVGGLAVTAIGSLMYRAARALSRSGAKRVLQVDPRPPALYLRSFADDKLTLPVTASARRPLFELFSIRGADPFEESVAWELDSYAPVVAVGQPGGTLQTLGAAREHLAHDTWHDEIASRMDHAGLIVLAPGETPGLAWELAEIVPGGHLGKAVFVFPPLPPSELQRRWSHTSGLLCAAGARIGALTTPAGQVHTLRVEDAGALFVTAASRRDEATYRTAVDRAVGDSVSPTTKAEPVATPAGVAG
jgi:hypothetical protein